MDVKVVLHGVDGGSTLLELLDSAARAAVEVHAGIAFVTKGGVDLFFSLDSVARLALQGNMELYIGIDAITDRPALEVLQEKEQVFGGLRVRVFRNPEPGLFHPKVFHFRRSDGSVESICGSGNLTRGGLQGNIEASTVLRLSKEEADEAEFSWLDALPVLAANCEPISEEILKIAEQNATPRMKGRKKFQPVEAESAEDGSEPDEGLFLIGFVPKAGGRWAQLHLNMEVLPRFFMIPAVSGETVVLTHVASDGRRAGIENRQVVLSDTNQNVKIELGAGHGRGYRHRPIVIFRRIEPRRFDYMLLVPGDTGHHELSILLNEADDSIGRGLTRVVRTRPDIQASWPGCPLI